MRSSSLVFAFLLAAAPLPAQSFNNYAEWDNTADAWSPFGANGTSTYGRTFQALNVQLDDFSFWLDGSDAFPGTFFTPYIAEWTGTQIGAILWSGSLTGNHNGGWYEQFTFATGGLALTNGATYVAFLHADAGGAVVMQMPRIVGGTPHDGAFVYENGTYGAAGLGALASAQWDYTGYPTGDDVAFAATFSGGNGSGQEVVPEPATMSLMALGLAGMAGVRRRKR